MTALILWLAVREPVAFFTAACVLCFGLWFGVGPAAIRAVRRVRGVSRRSQFAGLEHLRRISVEQASPVPDDTEAFPAVATLPFPAVA
jgi:hypothetical protein